MKKYILLTLMICVMASMWASGIYRFPITVKQPDGTTLTLIGHGDENFHWSTTTDGVIVVRSGDSFYVADIDDDGKLKPTKLLAHNRSDRSLQENDIIAQQDKQKFIQIAEETMAFHRSVRKASIEQNAKYPYTPHTGNVRGIIILTEFADTIFTLPNPKKSFEFYLNGDHAGATDLVNGESNIAGSVHKYFNDMSFGNFSLSFDVYGPVKVSGKTSDYVKDKSKLVREACLAADNLIDFSNPLYDADGDGIVDFVSIVTAGYSASYAASSDLWIWPSSNGTNIGKFDGAQVYRWLVCNELNGFPGAFATEPYCRINGIGLFCHEFSHCMGLPDLYPTVTYARIDNQEMEYWDLMDGGEYLHDGYCPTPYTAWERETMGWMTIDTLFNDRHHIKILPIDHGGKAYRFMNPNDNNKLEHMMIENIQNKGWNHYQKGHGLLVYHVNYPSDLVNVSDHPNNVKGEPRMAVVPADGLLMSSYNFDDANNSHKYFEEHSGDPFPGSKGVTSLYYDMNLPNYKWYNGDRKVKQALLNITEDNITGAISFDYVTDYSQVDIDPLDTQTNNTADGIDINTISNSINNQDQHIFTVDGRLVNTDMQLPKGIYIKGKRKFVVR